MDDTAASVMPTQAPDGVGMVVERLMTMYILPSGRNDTRMSFQLPLPRAVVLAAHVSPPVLISSSSGRSASSAAPILYGPAPSTVNWLGSAVALGAPDGGVAAAEPDGSAEAGGGWVMTGSFLLHAA